ncbi:MAG: hypothetical protein ABEJ25_03485 [Candidatus Bipolaricaulia bacterium]
MEISLWKTLGYFDGRQSLEATTSKTAPEGAEVLSNGPVALKYDDDVLNSGRDKSLSYSKDGSIEAKVEHSIEDRIAIATFVLAASASLTGIFAVLIKFWIN